LPCVWLKCSESKHPPTYSLFKSVQLCFKNLSIRQSVNPQPGYRFWWGTIASICTHTPEVPVAVFLYPCHSLSITHLHMDHYSATQYFIHLMGAKLWLKWPPTEHNLSYLSTFHRQQAQVDQITNCIAHIEGLEVFWIKQPLTMFTLRPNTIHICISIVGSHQLVHVGPRTLGRISWNAPVGCIVDKK